MKRFLIVLAVLLAVPLSTFAADSDKDKYNEYLSGYDLSFFEQSLDDVTYDYIKSLGLDDFDFENISGLQKL